MSTVLVVGLSHKTAPVDVRERLAMGKEAVPAVLARLSARPELREVMFLSTCNRVEVHALVDDEDAANEAIREVLAEEGKAGSPDALAPFLYARSGDEAVRHIFRVTASLDSMVLGEPQILGQVKDAYDLAKTAGTLGSFLGRCVHRAFTVAKRVRTETALGAGTVSISSVAVDLARRIFGDLGRSTVLLVGAGEMAEQAAKALGKGAHALRVCNRSFDRAAALAKEYGASAERWEQLEDEIISADIVVASTASREVVITRDMVKRAMKARRYKTLFFVDIAVPRNVEASVHAIDNVYVYNVDDLEQQVAEGLKSRQAEVAAAEKIVAQELADFQTWARGLHVQPTVVALRAKTRAIFLAELQKTLGGRLKHLVEGDRDALAQMVESAVNKLLHAPTTRLKASAAEGAAADLASALKHLFDLRELATQESEPQDSTRPPALARDEDKGLPN
jgi:glutamyl-tRNA reductase